MLFIYRDNLLIPLFSLENFLCTYPVTMTNDSVKHSQTCNIFGQLLYLLHRYVDNLSAFVIKSIYLCIIHIKQQKDDIWKPKTSLKKWCDQAKQ